MSYIQGSFFISKILAWRPFPANNYVVSPASMPVHIPFILFCMIFQVLDIVDIASSLLLSFCLCRLFQRINLFLFRVFNISVNCYILHHLFTYLRKLYFYLNGPWQKRDSYQESKLFAGVRNFFLFFLFPYYFSPIWTRSVRKRKRIPPVTVASDLSPRNDESPARVHHSVGWCKTRRLWSWCCCGQTFSQLTKFE